MKTTLLLIMGVFTLQLTLGQNITFDKGGWTKTEFKQIQKQSPIKKELLRTHKKATEKLDSAISAGLDSSTMSFDLWDKHIYTYNHNDELILEHIYSWSIYYNQWVKSQLHEYTYDTTGNLIKEIIYSWADTTWNLFAKYTHDYEANGYLIVDSAFSWNGYLWDCLGYTNYTNNVNGNKTSYTSYYMPWWTNSWTPSEKIEWSYNTNGNITLVIDYEWDDGSNTWNPLRKVENIYDINNLLIEEIIYNHDNNVWEKITKYEYTYDINNNKIGTTAYLWDKNNYIWIDLTKTETIYDTYGNKLTETVYQWNQTGGIWNYNFKYDYVYNNLFSLNAKNLAVPSDISDFCSNGELLSVTVFKWETSTNTWRKDIETDYYYSGITDITELTKENNVSVFPNPSNGIINIKTKNAGKEDLKVEITNINGQLIYNKQFNNNTIKQIDLSKQPKGIYFLKVQGDDIIKTEKIIVQ